MRLAASPDRELLSGVEEVMTNASRKSLERLVTRDNYVQISHAAEHNPTDPCQSYCYDMRARIHYSGSVENGLSVTRVGDRSFVSPIRTAQLGLVHL